MNDAELLRYSRHIMLSDIDVAGQEALLAAHILIVGLGGLGCPAALYLAAAGVGTLTLVDHDKVELGNLQRQIAHTTADIDQPKAESLAESVRALNPGVDVYARVEKLDTHNCVPLVQAADLVVDASDNFSIRFALNKACVRLQKPLVSAAAIRGEAQVAVFNATAASPCYRCLYDDAVDDDNLSCAQSGVLAPLVGIVGAMQALEAMKIIIGFGTGLNGYLLTFDAMQMEWRKLRLRKDPECPCCGSR
ncbi:MAG: HesA/MoeB/ThiF family protein [Pseudomonadales bacterium]